MGEEGYEAHQFKSNAAPLFSVCRPLCTWVRWSATRETRKRHRGVLRSRRRWKDRSDDPERTKWQYPCKCRQRPGSETLASLENPFTIYSPGLAGIAKSEEFISNGVLLRTIARGDANWVFRNILLRLSQTEHTTDWLAFLDDLRKLFIDIEVEVVYQSETDEHIMVFADTGSGRVPVELV